MRWRKRKKPPTSHQRAKPAAPVTALRSPRRGMPGWSCWNCPALCSGAHRWARPLVVLCSVLVRSAGRRRFFLTLSCTQVHDCVPSPRQRWHTSGNPLPLSSGGVAALSCRLIRSSFGKRRQETAAPGSGTAASCYRFISNGLSHVDHLPSDLLP